MPIYESLRYETLRVETSLRASASTGAPRVDKQAGIIYRGVIAESGPFRNVDRGEFTDLAMGEIRRLMLLDPKGLQADFGHQENSIPNPYLGRWQNPVIDTVRRDGVVRQVVRADLHLAQVALQPPPGGGTPYGMYLMNLVQEDPEAINVSLTLAADKTWRTGRDGRPLRNNDGEILAPLWMPTELLSADVVRRGEATRSFLAVDQPPQLLTATEADNLRGLRWRHKRRAESLADEERRRLWRIRKRFAGLA